MYSTDPSVCPSVRLFCLLPNLWTRYFKNDGIDFDANWRKRSARQGYEKVNSGVKRSEVKVTGGRM